jgi:hypothetical protein
MHHELRDFQNTFRPRPIEITSPRSPKSDTSTPRAAVPNQRLASQVPTLSDVDHELDILDNLNLMDAQDDPTDGSHAPQQEVSTPAAATCSALSKVSTMQLRASIAKLRNALDDQEKSNRLVARRSEELIQLVEWWGNVKAREEPQPQQEHEQKQRKQQEDILGKSIGGEMFRALWRLQSRSADGSVVV